MSDFSMKIDNWKKQLLDLGKRNKLINYKESKRLTLEILRPSLDKLYKELVAEEKSLKFSKPSFIENVDEDDTGEEKNIIIGDIQTNQKINDQQKTLSNLRNKSRLAKEEQGINILYLSFGFLNWKELNNSNQILVSPIILVPVKLTLESLTDPFVLSIDDDEIVVNPTLAFKLENDFGITLPEFNSDDDSVESYLKSLEKIISANDWNIDRKLSLSLFSFLKINMYKDLEKNRNKIKLNPIIRAIAGVDNQLPEPSSDLNNYEHDNKAKPTELFQVLDADSSQQDAILYAKKGISFVLQGPPGTGKSQTITNIISEALADGKKVLFVSEKMAALEVVYSRLEAANLGEFCLTLHSYKANKKEVIGQLFKMLNINKVELQDEALYELITLEYERNKLNEYDRELHTKCEPLNKSIYEVNGHLSQLFDVENVIFNIENVGQTTSERFNEYKYYLEAFSKTLEKVEGDYLLNPWRNSNVSIVSNELRYDIEKHLKDLLPSLKKMRNFCYELSAKYGISEDISINKIKELASILEISTKSPIVPINWLNAKNIEEFSKEATILNETKNEYKNLVNNLKERYDESYFLIDGSEIYNDFNSTLSDVKDILKHDKYDDELIIKEIPNIKLALTDVINVFKEIEELSDSIRNIFEIDNGFFNIKCIKEKMELLKLLLLNPKPSEMWFDDDELIVIEKVFYEMKNNHFELTRKIEKLSERYDAKITQIDFESMLIRFKTEYTSFFKILNKNYKNDKNILKSYSKEVLKNIDDNECVELLNEVKAICELQEYFKNNEQKFIEYFGNHFKKEYTNYEELKKCLNDYKIIKDYYKGKAIPNIIKSLLIKGDMSEIMEISGKLDRCIINNKDIDELNDILDSVDKINDTDIISEITSLQDILNTFNILEQNYNCFKMYGNDNSEYNDTINDLKNLIRIQSICCEVDKKANILKGKFEYLYNGIDSDWIEILNKLDWFGKFKKLIEEYELPKEFKELVCSNVEFIEQIKHQYNIFCEKNKLIESDFNCFINLFEVKEEFLEINLSNLIERIEACYDNIAALEMWIDYRNSRSKCREIGLGDYIDKIENMKIKSNMLIPIFLKRFYRLWLDTIIIDKPAIIEFRGGAQEERMHNFSKLDLKQLDIAKYRIRERLISSLPDANLMTSSKDQVGILKREAGKQRKIMSLRNLFKSIPELLLTLKPCLMMSPLSVSMFLESDAYKFDLVIFDEASQVCTEDAIGAIYRGKQVIIAGDKEQLPPTNFFSTSVSDGDFDGDDEENIDDINSYESVLDEALSALPERTLLWHYRSRHEHLIAFSNTKVYGGNLITFPSNMDKVKNNGVEYVYVNNGVYERGGKKCNPIEAKKVAEMVFEHITNFPNRSLGVVTFSQAQQNAIEIAINDLRISNPKYEEFFNEDKEEAFFIKNLENVQGDERDTIIFSIGYAKDNNGKLYMNFGPLSRDGGYRRLNVAITRAKYNVKLVGSIVPTDIDLNRTNSEGVKMLRSYIEFAMQGMNALENEVTVSDSICLESPFEQSVHDFLVSKGYNVAKQVGCSGYRIDLAIKHPTISGTFVLGIECDGATYHSARTARERDRLRQSVLEGIGWKIYRIWSTDWIKDKTTEGNRLIQAIDEAIAQYDNNPEGAAYTSINNNKLNTDMYDYLIEKENEEILDADNPFGFEIYQEADIYDIEGDGSKEHLADVIWYVVDREYPIHFELLCKRVAVLFGNQKVTERVRIAVKAIIKGNVSNCIEIKKDFCWIKDRSDVVVRIPSKDSDTPRVIQHIAKEEVAEAMLKIIEKSFGIDLNSLISVTGKVFGFNRLGPNIVDSIESAYKQLIEQKRIKNIDDKIIINND